jgi:hypothetical protein
VALEDPVGHEVNDVQALAATPPQAGQDLVGELAQRARQVGASIALEVAPLAFLAVRWGL